MCKDPKINMQQHDLIVVCICDGFEKIPDSFKKFAKKHQFLDEEVLKAGGFMKEEREGEWTMKNMHELMDKKVKEADIPKNVLHLFQLCSWDFGLEENEKLNSRRINFIFALK